jgi:dipeptidyl aminopeptidase/acylaminoacyl peptidase
MTPLDRIHPDAPPFLIIHGDHDTVTPASAGRQFATQLQRASAQLAA